MHPNTNNAVIPSNLRSLYETSGSSASCSVAGTVSCPTSCVAVLSAEASTSAMSTFSVSSHSSDPSLPASGRRLALALSPTFSLMSSQATFDQRCQQKKKQERETTYTATFDGLLFGGALLFLLVHLVHYSFCSGQGPLLPCFLSPGQLLPLCLALRDPCAMVDTQRSLGLCWRLHVLQRLVGVDGRRSGPAGCTRVLRNSCPASVYMREQLMLQKACNLRHS